MKKLKTPLKIIVAVLIIASIPALFNHTSQPLILVGLLVSSGILILWEIYEQFIKQ